MRRLTILPPKGIPPSGYGGPIDEPWFVGDTARDYNARGGHPVYGEDDIRYRLNSHGYRCPEFEEQAAIRIISVGCSYVFGTGLPVEHLFHERFAARLRAKTGRSVVVWNLGVIGTSNDYITRILFLAVRALDPHLVLINFTHPVRREYLSLDQKLVAYTPLANANDPVAREILGHFRALSSRSDDLLNFFRNYKAVEALLRNRTWLYSTIDRHRLEPIAEHLDPTRYCGELQTLDTARDELHPGTESHKALAEGYWKRFELGGLSQVTASP
jgi:hypothetical protein